MLLIFNHLTHILMNKKRGYQKLTGVYTVKQCCDINDCLHALNQIWEMVRINDGVWTYAMRKRCAALTNKLEMYEAKNANK